MQTWRGREWEEESDRDTQPGTEREGEIETDMQPARKAARDQDIS